MIPTPALSEYLQVFDREERRRQLEVFERHFVIPAFDIAASYLAAGIAHRADRPPGVGRQAVKTDIQILATAITAGAQVVVTDEADHFRKLSGSRIQIAAVPELQEQRDLDFD